MTNAMHKFFIYLSIDFCLKCFRLSISPFSEAGVQLRQWFKAPVYGVSALAMPNLVELKWLPSAPPTNANVQPSNRNSRQQFCSTTNTGQARNEFCYSSVRRNVKRLFLCSDFLNPNQDINQVRYVRGTTKQSSRLLGYPVLHDSRSHSYSERCHWN
jgi:hypothetical protein